MRQPLGRLRAWLDDRTGYSAVVRSFLSQPVPGGARWSFALGAALVVLLVLEFVTGALLAFYYSPSASTAWASVAYIQDELTLGWFIRGLHSFGSSAMVVVAGLHLLQVMLFGAYKAPRETNWIIGLVMFGLVVAFAITGYGLPWDQKGYWAKLVETSIMGGLPVVGPYLEKIVQGGSGYGNYTVTHFFAVHAFVLPVAMVSLLAAHLYLVRRHSVTPSWKLSPDVALSRSEPYWPGQAFRDVVTSALTVAVVATFVIALRGADLEGPADPASGYMARPEWYARPLYQLRLYFEGPTEMVATMVIPGLVAGLLFTLPFLDRGPVRAPHRRLPVMIGTMLGCAGVFILGLASISKDEKDPAYLRHRVEVKEQADLARSLAKKGVLPEGGLAVFRNDPAHQVRELWREHCANCHSFSGAGGEEGPDLMDYNSRTWILGFLKDPQGPLYMGPAKKEKGMKPVEGTDEELSALTEFVYSQTGAADVDTNRAKEGEVLFSAKNCDACHEIDGTTDAKGPNLLARGSLPYVIKLIGDAGRPELYGDRAKMPKFSGKLSPEEIEMLAKFVVALKKS